jgi:hypothetical protein
LMTVSKESIAIPQVRRSPTLNPSAWTTPRMRQ